MLTLGRKDSLDSYIPSPPQISTMSFEAFYSEYAQGRVYWLVVYLKKPATPLAFSSTMLDRVQPSANDANIVVDLHTPGINVRMAAGKVIRVMVQNLNFELDCTQGVKLVEDPAMRFQEQVWTHVVKEC